MNSALMAAGEPMAFLKLGVGARAAGLGGAYTAISDDAAGVFYNPAGITGIDSLQLSAETYLLTFGRMVNFISACKPFNLAGHSYSAGLSWLNYSAGADIEARSTNSPLPERRISDNSHLAVLTLATGISDRVFFGINAKLDLRVIDDVKGTGFGFDAGIMVKIIEGLNAGFSAVNLSANTWWDNRDFNEPAPQSYNFGLSYGGEDIFGILKLDALVSLDLVLNTFGFMKLKAGAEIRANDFFFLRAGYNGNAFAAGCGAGFSPSDKITLRVDYALVFDTVADASINHRIGLVSDFMIEPEDKENEKPKGGVKDEDKAESEDPW